MSARQTPDYLVSAIVSSYNAERFLRGRLEDLEAQTVAGELEIIVIDSGSQQDERSIVAEFQGRYPNIRYLRTEKRETVYQAWNRGIKMATGEFVTNANTDDRLRRDALETLVRALREHPECVLAYPDMRITQQENASFEAHLPLGTRDWPPYDRFALLELCCVGPFPLWRRSLHGAIGYFDERYGSAADYEFWLRASERYQFIHVPQFLGLYWLSEETVSRCGDLPTLEYLQIQKEYRARFARFAPPPVELPASDQEHFGSLVERIRTFDGVPMTAGETISAAPGQVGRDPSYASRHHEFGHPARRAEVANALLRELEQFVERHPAFAAAQYQLAQIYYKKGETGFARKHFEKASLLEPGSEYAETLRGFLRLDLYQSLQHHTASLSAHPDDLDSRLSAGMICILLERFEAASGHYRHALEIEPDNALARENLAALERRAAQQESEKRPEPVAPQQSATLAGSPDPLLTSIVIPTCNGLDLTRECLESIARNTPEPHEIILVDHGSTDGTLTYLRELCAGGAHYRLLENGTHPGFAAGCNLGMRLARGGRILLLKNDVVVTRGWLGGMLDCLGREHGAAIVGPMSNEVAGPQRVTGTAYRSTGELEEYARAFARLNGGRRIPVPGLAGFCMLFTRTLMASVGDLDPGLGSDQLEDDDFCLRAALAGYGCVIAGDIFIHHYDSRSCQADGSGHARATTASCRAHYEAKWSLGRLDEGVAKKVVTRNALIQGRRLARQGQLSQAVDLLLQQGIQFSPDSPAPYRVLAGLLADAGSFQNALEVLEQTPGGEEVTALLLASRCHAALGRPDRARELAERALQLDPGSAGALHLMGTLALGHGASEAAEEFLRAGMSADPGFGPCYTTLAGLHWERGARETGLELAELGFVLSPLELPALARFSDYARELGLLAREEDRVREARAIFPDHQGLAYALIEILIQHGAYREALEEIERAAVDFGMDDGMIDAALSVRDRVGPLSPPPGPDTLSLCLIVKDEARQLPALLHSVRGLADEIIVVDTGSSDRSVDIARVFGARLFCFPWNGSFSEARNFSLAQASCGWILVLDADELLAECDLSPLRALLSRPAPPTAYSFTTRNYTREIARRNWTANAGEYPGAERGCGWTPSDKVRLFPNDPRLRFEGAVHELLEPALLACAIPIHACDVPVHHYGKLDPDKTLQKQEQYYRLGLKKFTETGGDFASLLELASQATELERFREARELWHRLLLVLPDSAEAHFNLGYLHLVAAEYPAARRHALRAVQLDPTLKEAAFNLAKCELFLGNTAAALQGSREMLQSWPDYPPALSLHCACSLILGSTGEGEALMARLSEMGFDCPDFLREYAEGLLRGERGDLAHPLLGLAQEISGLRRGGRHACC